MRKIATVALLLVALLLVFAEPSLAWRGQHHGGTRVFIGFGGYYPYYPYYPYWYYPPPYYTYSPPPVVVQEPPVYVQQPQQSSVTVAPAPSAPEAYWYYCPSSRGYYPSVQTCPETWVKVPPRQD
ncbi:MAG: hypothetical protein DMD78_09610 [Candidatus Rokuibacteriota bacterium]|nr:MAG: hypothetical protein DMD78_09610 [Candidatus Rokubacteria bacterium]